MFRKPWEMVAGLQSLMMMVILKKLVVVKKILQTIEWN